MKNAGIIVQDLDNAIIFDDATSCYCGLSKYIAFPLTSSYREQYNPKVANLIKHVLKTDVSTQLTYISCYKHFVEYIEACASQDRRIRAIFFEIENSNIVWHGSIPTTSFLGYEFVYSDYSDPEFSFCLANEFPFEKFKKLLNQHGLFRTREEAEQFGEALYTIYPHLNEEMPFSETFVLKLYEIVL